MHAGDRAAEDDAHRRQERGFNRGHDRRGLGTASHAKAATATSEQAAASRTGRTFTPDVYPLKAVRFALTNRYGSPGTTGLSMSPRRSMTLIHWSGRRAASTSRVARASVP